MTTRETQDVIVRLLGNIGSKKEVEQYLRHYASVDAPKFAVVNASGPIVENDLDALASSLAFLQRVGLVPIVVHGPSSSAEGPLDTARRALHDTNLRLVEAVEALGTRARPFTSGILELGTTGEVTAVKSTAIAQTASSGILPIVAPLGETSTGQVLVADADEVTRALALSLTPHKVVYLTERGGLYDERGVLRSAVNLAEDLEDLLADPSIGQDMRTKLATVDALLAALPPRSSVSITSPEHLAKELFTHRGAGTLVRRGERIRCHTSWDTVDRERLRVLLEECFGRRLDDAYFEQKAPYRVYLSDSYRATAILTMEDGVPYLDKFAVTSEAQGEGIGGSLWQRLRRETPKLFWRARATNPVNGWYAQSADGLVKSDKWWVFWCGMHDFAEIQRSVETALAMPATFHDGPPSQRPMKVS